MSEQPTDLVPAILRAIQADLAEIKEVMVSEMATKADILALRHDIMNLRSSLVADIRSEFNLLHSRLDTLERTRR